MTLLDSITKAAAAADAGELIAVPKIPITLNSRENFLNLESDYKSPFAAPSILRVSGWAISDSDSVLIKETSKFSKSLRKKLKNSRLLDRAVFLQLLTSFLRRNGQKLGLSLDSELCNDDTDSTRSLIEKVGFLISKEVACLVVDGCIVLGLWELLETLIAHGFVDHLYSTNLIEKLVHQNQAGLLCLCVKHVADLRPSEILSVLRYFLSPSTDAYHSMLEVKKKWESHALLAIEKATKKDVPKKAADLAREASVLLMLAHDGFSASESCLHYMFGNSNIDELVFSSVVSRLSGAELLALIRYLVKWLKKYQRFPEAGPCLQASSALSLSACEDVPSFDLVIRALGLVLDEHFSYFVMNPYFHDEIRAILEVVNVLSLEADESGPVDEIVKHLRSQFSKHGRRFNARDGNLD